MKDNVKHPLEAYGAAIPEEFKGLFNDPPLLEGEDPDHYWALLAAMIKDRKPEKFAEWVVVHDTVDKLWEERQFKRASAGLMRSGMFNAAEQFLNHFHADGKEPELKRTLLDVELLPPPLTAAEKLAFKYFGKDLKEREEVASLFARYGVTPAALQAKAAELNSGPIQMFEAMRARRERERRRIRQDDEKFLQSRKSSKTDVA
jgi:hypothetical protein